MMSLPAHLQIHFHAETPDHDAAVEALTAEAFGPGRHAKAAARVREMAPHDRALSFVAVRHGEIVGSVRLTRVAIGGTPAVMLGPLAVKPACKGKGAGRALMALAAEAARAAGERLIFLVGDRAYYMPLGYEAVAPGTIGMPGPVDEARILALALVQNGLEGVRGRVAARR